MIIGLLILIPLVASLLLFTINHAARSKKIALAASLLTLGISLYALIEFIGRDFSPLSLTLPLRDIINVDLFFRTDGISLVMILLSTILLPIIVSSTRRKEYRTGNFYGLMLLMQAALIGVFSASEMILFYVFWELALIPIFFMIIIWGGEHKKGISTKFLIYTIVGSFIMLITILYLYTLTPGTHSFTFESFYQLKLTNTQQLWVFLGFFLAFAIKIPLFPFHSWQAETYNVAPVQGTMLMAGIMLKMGLYGIIRFILPLTPHVVSEGSLFFLPFILIGVIYAAIIAIKQAQLKKLIAFASLSHVGMIALGLLSNQAIGIAGAVLQSFSHGINVVALLLCYDIITQRTNTDRIAELGGIATKAPKFAVLFLIVLLANIGLPLTNSFVGEFMILLGLFKGFTIYAIVAGLSIILGAVYMLRVYQKIMYGVPTAATSEFRDLCWKEVLIFIPILVLILALGLAPSSILNLLETSIR